MQIQLKLAIDAIHALVIPALALDIPQVQKAQAKAPVTLPLRQSFWPVTNHGILIAQSRYVSIAGLADREA